MELGTGSATGVMERTSPMVIFWSRVTMAHASTESLRGSDFPSHPLDLLSVFIIDAHVLVVRRAALGFQKFVKFGVNGLCVPLFRSPQDEAVAPFPSRRSLRALTISWLSISSSSSSSVHRVRTSGFAHGRLSDRGALTPAKKFLQVLRRLAPLIHAALRQLPSHFL